MLNEQDQAGRLPGLLSQRYERSARQAAWAICRQPARRTISSSIPTNSMLAARLTVPPRPDGDANRVTLAEHGKARPKPTDRPDRPLANQEADKQAKA